MSRQENERERLKLALHARRTRKFGAVLMKAMIGTEDPRYRELVNRLRHDPDLPGVERAFMDLATARAGDRRRRDLRGRAAPGGPVPDRPGGAALARVAARRGAGVTPSGEAVADGRRRGVVPSLRDRELRIASGWAARKGEMMWTLESRCIGCDRGIKHWTFTLNMHLVMHLVHRWPFVRDDRFWTVIGRLANDSDSPSREHEVLELCAQVARETGDAEAVTTFLRGAGLLADTLSAMRWVAAVRCRGDRSTGEEGAPIGAGYATVGMRDWTCPMCGHARRNVEDGRRSQLIPALRDRWCFGKDQRYWMIAGLLTQGDDLPAAERAIVALAAEIARERGDAEGPAAFLREAGLLAGAADKLRWRDLVAGRTARSPRPSRP